MSSKKKWVIGLCSIGGVLAVAGVVAFFIKKTFDAIGSLDLDFTDDDIDAMML